MLGRSYPGQTCSAASALELVGERWSLLILRDALFRGHTRYSDFQKGLGIAPNILARRLERFLGEGLMETRTGPGGVREYHLTARGRDLKGVIIALNTWGDRWLREGPVDYVHRGCGGIVGPVHRCHACSGDVPLDSIEVQVRRPGPGEAVNG